MTRSSRLSPSLAVPLVAAALFVGCATSPDPRPGVRPDYRRSCPDRVAVVPFFARSRFGLAESELEQRLEWAQSVAVAWLSNQRVDTVAPDATQARLEQADSWNHFDHRGVLRADLANSFESADPTEKGTHQFQRLDELRERDALPARFLLFGEVLYHTATDCNSRADSYNERSSVVVQPSATTARLGPCVVTHFQARLVDAESGRTVWFNRRLVEHHLGRLQTGDIRFNVRRAVKRTLGGDDGLLPVLRPDS